jgi:hypothetical protein
MRLFLFVAVALYGSTAVAIFDAFWPHLIGGTTSLKPNPGSA